jgi:hypothetical protein
VKYGDKLGQQLSSLLRAADDLGDAARRLREVADDARRQRAHLDRLMQSVFDRLARSHNPEALLTGHGVTAFPPRWDTGWEDVHRKVFEG